MDAKPSNHRTLKAAFASACKRFNVADRDITIEDHASQRRMAFTVDSTPSQCERYLTWGER
jgi:hypothetical protein